MFKAPHRGFSVLCSGVKHPPAAMVVWLLSNELARVFSLVAGLLAYPNAIRCRLQIANRLYMIEMNNS